MRWVGLADAPSREALFALTGQALGELDGTLDQEALKGAPPGKPGMGICIELAALPFTATGGGTCTTGAGVAPGSSARRFTLLLPRPEYRDGAIESASPCAQRMY